MPGDMKRENKDISSNLFSARLSLYVQTYKQENGSAEPTKNTIRPGKRPFWAKVLPF